MRTHPLNIGYLVVGLVFLGIAGSWALSEAGVVDADGLQWALPVTLVLAGAAGLLAAALKALRGEHREEAGRLAAEPVADDADLADTYGYDDSFGARLDAKIAALDTDPASSTDPVKTDAPRPAAPSDPATDTIPDTTSDTKKDDDR